MGNSGLTAVSALGGYKGRFDDTQACEIVSLAIVSITVPCDGMEAIDKTLNEHWHVAFPGVGKCVSNNDVLIAGKACSLVFYGLQTDQCFLAVESGGHSTQDIVDYVNAVLNPVAYLTDQSDSWAVLEVEGPLMMPAMERICMLDLATMMTPCVARTTMEHLSVIINKQGDERVWLFSPRSSASSFLHAVTTSLQNVKKTS